jgi:hypothetical protein
MDAKLQGIIDDAKAAVRRGDSAEVRRLQLLFLETAVNSSSPEARDAWHKRQEREACPDSPILF